jgi:hypothetical protein
MSALSNPSTNLDFPLPYEIPLDCSWDGSAQEQSNVSVEDSLESLQVAVSPLFYNTRFIPIIHQLCPSSPSASSFTYELMSPQSWTNGTNEEVRYFQGSSSLMDGRRSRINRPHSINSKEGSGNDGHESEAGHKRKLEDLSWSDLNW